MASTVNADAARVRFIGLLLLGEKVTHLNDD
jgi:hypothetical protein